MEVLGGTNKEMLKYNRCRMSLRVLTMAKIVTPDETQLDYDMMIDRKNLLYETSYQWPKQLMMSKTFWKEWKEVLVPSLYHPGTLILRTPLGE